MTVERYPSFQRASDRARLLAKQEGEVMIVRGYDDGFWYVAESNEHRDLAKLWHKENISYWKDELYAQTDSPISDHEISDEEYYRRGLAEIYFSEGGYVGGWR